MPADDPPRRTTGLIGDVSETCFPLTMPGRIVVLGVMLVAIHAAVGFGPIRAIRWTPAP